MDIGLLVFCIVIMKLGHHKRDGGRQETDERGKGNHTIRPAAAIKAEHEVRIRNSQTHHLQRLQSLSRNEDKQAGQSCIN